MNIIMLIQFSTALIIANIWAKESKETSSIIIAILWIIIAAITFFVGYK